MGATTNPPTLTPPPMGSGMGGDQQTLLGMLGRIRKLLDTVVHSDPPLVPRDLQPLLRETWPQADESFQSAKGQLVDEVLFRELYDRLQMAGLTGAMLGLKNHTLHVTTDRLEKEILTYSRQPGFWERLVRLARPAFRSMNSFLGSLASVLPVLEIAREYKEQVEVAVDTMGEAGNR